MTSQLNGSACYGWQNGRLLVAASSPAADSPAPASEPAGRPASHLKVLAVPAPALEGSAAVHDHRDVEGRVYFGVIQTVNS